MPLYANNLLDEITSRPIEGAHVYVYTLDGATEASIQDELGAAVTQPLVTGADGDYAFQAPTGLYQLVFWKNARRIYRDRAVQVGTGPVLPADVLTALGGVDGASYVGTTDGDTVQEHIDAIASAASFVTPEDFGAIGDEVTDDGAALNAWLAYIAENRVPFAALTGNYRTTIPISYDFNYGDGGWTTDKTYTTTIYCHARIRGDGAMDKLFSVIKAPFLKFVGNLHLLGLPDGQGFPWSVRNINTGLYFESCGNFDMDFLHVTGFAIYGVETGPAGTSDNHSHFHHIAASRVGSGPRDGTADRGKRTTFSARVDTGSANSFDQRSVLTVASMHPVYLDSNGRCSEIRIGGTGPLYTILEVDRGANTISVFPWIEGGVTAGDIEYYFGAAFCALGNDANLINVGGIQAQACGGEPKIAPSPVCPTTVAIPGRMPP